MFLNNDSYLPAHNLFLFQATICSSLSTNSPHHSPCLQSVAFTFPGCRQKGARGGGLAALEQLTNMASTPKNMTPPNTGRVAKKGWKQQERNPHMGYISLLSGYTIHTPSGYYPYMEIITESQIPMTSTDGQSIYGIIWKWDIYIDHVDIAERGSQNNWRLSWFIPRPKLTWPFSWNINFQTWVFGSDGVTQESLGWPVLPSSLVSAKVSLGDYNSFLAIDQWPKQGGIICISCCFILHMNDDAEPPPTGAHRPNFSKSVFKPINNHFGPQPAPKLFSC